MSPRSYRARLLAVPLGRALASRAYRFTHLYTIICEASDGHGRKGVSGLWFPKREQAEVVLAALRYLAPTAAIDDDPGKHRGPLMREMSFLGYKGVTVMAVSAFEMALRDLRLRNGDLKLPPVRRDRVRAYWSGFLLDDSAAEWEREAQAAGERGFAAFKARVGHPDIAQDVERIGLLRDCLPRGAPLMVDAHQAWEVDAAISAVEHLAQHDLTWVEDPLAHNDYEGLAQLTSRSPIPIAAGENEYLPGGFRQLIDAGVSVLLADLERAGGIAGWDRVAALAKAHDVILTPHLYPQVAVQLCARLDQEEQWLEYVDWWDPLMARPLRFEGGAAIVEDVPGSGFEPDPDALERFALNDWEQLMTAGDVK